ncbi:MAG TPA: hypothetical protein VNM72_08230 [Blastocatellia bacterium]|nr:hypothetical protein [Blastocatellia bacterium]
MVEELTSKERDEIRSLLQPFLGDAGAEAMVTVLERIVAREAHLARKDIQDLRELSQQLIEGQRQIQAALLQLAQAQAHTEERVGRLEEAIVRLAEAQARSEERLARLEDVQAQTVERVGRLEEAVARLAEAQARSEVLLAETRERVSRLEEAVARLAEAQARSEVLLAETRERVGRLEEAVAQLIEAQARTEKAQQRMEKALVRLDRQVGGLSETVGGDIEDIAYIVLHDVLQREFGWKVGVLERSWKVWGGREVEINLLGQAHDPSQPNRVIWIVGEAKHNFTLKEARKFAHRVEQARKHLEGTVFPVCFCYRARPEVQDFILDNGFALVFSYGRMKMKR